ncbi:MAG: substrate-binding domain-containing protein [Acidimicrobiales bacterium]
MRTWAPPPGLHPRSQTSSPPPRHTLLGSARPPRHTLLGSARPPRHTLLWFAAVGLLAVALTACSSPATTRSSGSSSTSRASAATASGHGQPVDVLYAGSLTHLMQDSLGPAFDRATGDTFVGFTGGSDGLASEIRGGTQVADVFVSAAPSADRSLEGKANGSWVSWYATFATSPLVLGYNPASRFASQLRTRPWYDVVTQPGFLLGRTDPRIDPKGVLAVEALDQTATAQHLPHLAGLTSSTAGVFPEETLVGRLQAGQLDAGFFYEAEAVAAGIPTVPLTGVHLGATFTVTVVDRAPQATAAAAFVRFLLGRRGQALLRSAGMDLVRPPVVDGRSAVPADLRATLGAT